MVDPRTPVLIGAGQLSNRVDRGADVLEPVDLIVEALRRAADDAGAGDAALTGADAVHTVGLLSWRYRDPAALVGERVGADAAGHVGHRHGRQRAAVAGQPHVPRDPARRVGPRPARRRRGVAHPDGRSVGRRRARLDGAGRLGARGAPVDPRGADVVAGRAGPRRDDAGAGVPAVRAGAPRRARPRPRRAPRSRCRELWAGFSEVAATNPHAWIQEAYTAEEIRTPSPDNRMIGFPYTKRLNSNNAVEQGAAADPVLGGAGRGARRAPRPLGVPAQRHRRPRPLLRERARRPRPLPRHARGRPGVPRPGRGRRRRPRPHRPLLLLPVGGGDLRLRARDRHSTGRSPSPAACPSPADRGTTT